MEFSSCLVGLSYVRSCAYTICWGWSYWPVKLKVPQAVAGKQPVVALCVAFDENSNDNGEPATAGSSSDARSSKVNFSVRTINMCAL